MNILCLYLYDSDKKILKTCRCKFDNFNKKCRGFVNL